MTRCISSVLNEFMRTNHTFVYPLGNRQLSISGRAGKRTDRVHVVEVLDLAHAEVEEGHALAGLDCALRLKVMLMVALELTAFCVSECNHEKVKNRPRPTELRPDRAGINFGSQAVVIFMLLCWIRVNLLL